MARTLLRLAVCLLPLTAAAAGCAKARAQTVPDGPPLAIPAPPSRVFAPIEDEEPLASAPAAPETQEPAKAPALTSTAKPPRPRPQETERVEQPPAPAPAPAPSPETPRELRAASAPADAEAERKIGEVMKRASQTLGNVYYQGLTPARQEQYDQAKAFLREAEQAIKERNFVYAQTLADKAAKLASELSGR
jgi:hypothetical protein